MFDFFYERSLAMQKWRLMEGSQGMLEENSPFLEPEAWAISDNFTTLDIKHLSIYHTLQVLDLNSTSLASLLDVQVHTLQQVLTPTWTHFFSLCKSIQGFLQGFIKKDL